MDLIAALRRICGENAVQDGAEAGGLGRDATGKYHWRPLAVVRPRDTAQVSAVLQLAGQNGVSVVPVSGNTGLNGGTRAEGAIMLSTERMNRIRDIDPAARTATVEAGVILQTLHEELAPLGLGFPMTFGARGSARIGGILSTNAGGSNVLRYGNMRALCLGVEVVLADGRVMNLMSALHKDNTGYDLRDLFIGAEGTLGIITAAVLKLSPLPRAHVTAVVAMARLEDALSLLNALQAASGGGVEAFEYMPDIYMDRLARYRPDLLPPITTGPVNLLIEAASTAPALSDPGPEGAPPLRDAIETVLSDAMEAGQITDAAVASSDAQRRKMWEMRESAAEITLNELPIVDTDIAVPLGAVAEYLDRMRARITKLDPQARIMIVAHLGDGNVHYTVYPSRDDDGLQNDLRQAISEEAVALGGSFSAEHGIGVSKLPTMAALKDPVALDVMRVIRQALDQQGILNPGKTIPK
ncbi:FAD-binding oxidoreductase [Paracoccus pacificus]|uniref:FAD-binding oxidoreductase n=1 Tax=Paracoccus pacificus TaxID=1463598 RepID=A0ABW4R834_9RHOB